jgi:hypothetical protein
MTLILISTRSEPTLRPPPTYQIPRKTNTLVTVSALENVYTDFNRVSQHLLGTPFLLLIHGICIEDIISKLFNLPAVEGIGLFGEPSHPT